MTSQSMLGTRVCVCASGLLSACSAKRKKVPSAARQSSERSPGAAGTVRGACLWLTHCKSLRLQYTACMKVLFEKVALHRWRGITIALA